MVARGGYERRESAVAPSGDSTAATSKLEAANYTTSPTLVLVVLADKDKSRLLSSSALRLFARLDSCLSLCLCPYMLLSLRISGVRLFEQNLRLTEARLARARDRAAEAYARMATAETHAASGIGIVEARAEAVLRSRGCAMELLTLRSA
eukprot:3219589-Pleurochrysis_carterae.AAC.2